MAEPSERSRGKSSHELVAEGENLLPLRQLSIFLFITLDLPGKSGGTF